MNKSAFEFSFTWLFAILAGAFIIFAAIYATMNLTRSSQFAGNTALAKQLSIIFNPLETGTASGKATEARLVQETRIYNKCFTDGSFGSQQFSLSQKSGILKEWPAPGGEIKISSKYVFSDKIEEGKKIYFFSKPFVMPFKVSELIFMYSEEYCFKNAPEFIKEEIGDLQLKNIKMENCTGQETEVCFNSGCDISVFPSCIENCGNEYETGYVRKNGKSIRFIGSLIYGAIFSEPDIYKCNFARLMKRVQQLSYLYSDEINFISRAGCGGISSFNELSGIAYSTSADSSPDLLREAAKKVDEENSAKGGCKIW